MMLLGAQFVAVGRRAVVAAGVLCILLGAGLAKAEPLKIRLSYIVPVANWATMLFQKPELQKHLGKSYTFEAIHFQSTPTLIQALAAGEIDIANLGFTSMPLAITNAGMKDLRIISDELQDGVPGYYSNEYMVRKDSPIQKVEDLKGKVLVTNGYGSGTDIPLRIMLAKHGLKDKRDVTIIEAPIPTMGAMLSERKADLIAWVLPFTANPKAHEDNRTLFTQGDAVGPSELGVWVARESFIQKNRAAMTDFMEDAMRNERWYNDPKNHEEAVQIAVKVSKIPAQVWESWLFKKDGMKGDYFRDPNGKPDIADMQKTIDEQVKYGFLKQRIEVKNYVDLSLVEAADKRLK
ncbi:MAG TPA: ABC transporter substrate-binding protein [Stellaceae bacterium]|nr:ABC transporter substrate-binding protein [Stellaceae bacterium]